MAQFTAQGRLKPLFDGDGMLVGFEPREPRHRHYKILGGAASFAVGFHKRKLIYQQDKGSNVTTTRSRSRLFASSSSFRSSTSPSSPSKSNQFGDAESSFNVEDEVGAEFEGDELSCFRGLVLDISYRPVNVVCWKRAICLEFMEKADVLEYYDQTVNSPSGSFYIPAVLRVPHLLQVVKRRRIKNTLSRKNIFYRDSFTCQYCSSRQNLTVDHVLPISRGGEWKWDNLVTACFKCNSRKGQKTLEEANMKLQKVPKAPKDYDILAIPLTTTAIKMLRMRKGTPEEWLQYLSISKPSSEL